MAINKVWLSGSLVRDVDFQQVGQTSISKMCIAVKRDFAKEGEQNCDFVNLVVFGKRAETCATYLKKGSKVNVVGSLKIDNYEDKQGNKKQSVSVAVSEIEFLSASTPQEKKEDTTPVVEEEIDEELLPF